MMVDLPEPEGLAIARVSPRRTEKEMSLRIRAGWSVVPGFAGWSSRVSETPARNPVIPAPAPVTSTRSRPRGVAAGIGVADGFERQDLGGGRRVRRSGAAAATVGRPVLSDCSTASTRSSPMPARISG